jgi:glycosyltransferase involved in cell wall biosynthesis
MSLMQQAAPDSNGGRSEIAPDISFVIPAFNEEAVLGRTVESIHRAMAGRASYEVILVDNGSEDGTVAIADELGVRTIIEPGITVAGLRNLGARSSHGQSLVFLDADVVLTEAWAEAIQHTLRKLRDTPRLLTGSWCGVPANPTWIENYWFQPLVHRPNSHINSGHMIMSRDTFFELGGFNEDLETGEDYELSTRALRAGASVVEDPRLAVIHHGYPQSLRAFVRREAWHGRSDFVSRRSVLSSKVAVATLIFAALHAALLIALALRSPTIAGVSVSLIVLLCTTASLKRYGPASTGRLLATTAIYYFYFVGRTVALISAVSGRAAFVHRAQR